MTRIHAQPRTPRSWDRARVRLQRSSDGDYDGVILRQLTDQERELLSLLDTAGRDSPSAGRGSAGHQKGWSTRSGPEPPGVTCRNVTGRGKPPAPPPTATRWTACSPEPHTRPANARQHLSVSPPGAHWCPASRPWRRRSKPDQVHRGQGLRFPRFRSYLRKKGYRVRHSGEG
jgi:hypothetical protein